MIEWITKFTEGAEEVVDVLTNSAGMIITRITPLLAPLASGFTVLFAFYDGGGRMLATIPSITQYAHQIAFWVGFVLMLALEGVNFSTTFNRDRAEKLKEKHAHELSGIDADQLVSYAFWLTVAIVFGLETAPGIIGFYQGTIVGSDLTFKAGLLILPFFSKIGAKIFSLAVILDGLEGTHEARRQRRLQVKRDAADLEIEIETKRKKAALDLEQTEAENKQRLVIELLRAETKLQGKSVKPNGQIERPESVQKSVQSGVLDNTNLASTEQRLNSLLNTILDTGWQGVSAIAKALDISRTTVYNDLNVLESRGLLRIIRAPDGKITDVTIGEISQSLPEPLVTLNGVH